VGLGTVTTFEGMRYDELNDLHTVAMQSGDEYLSAAIAEIKRLRGEVARRTTSYMIEKDRALEAEGYSEWLKDMFVEPHKQTHQIFWSRVTRCMEIIEDHDDVDLTPADKLEKIKAVLMEFDGEGLPEDPETPVTWWSPSMGLICLVARQGEIKMVQVMEADGSIGIGGRIVAVEPDDAVLLTPERT
jgi:hypothetical protein